MRGRTPAIVALAAGVITLAGGGCGQTAAKVQNASGRCDRSATPSTFASQIASATAGQTVCLGTGNYGNWTGTTKAIVVRPQPGASPTMTFDFGRSAANFTIDGGHTNLDSRGPGINLGASFFDPGSKNITIENVSATTDDAYFVIDIRSDGPGIVIRGNIFHDMEYPNRTSGAVRILPPDVVPSSNIVVAYNLFRDMGADGIDGGPGTIVGNDFSNVNSNSRDPRHTDVIQMGNGPDVIEGNFVHNGCVQGIDAFDGTSNNTIEDNVIVGCTVHSLVLAGDAPGSTVDHNTVVGASGGAVIECGSKPGEGPSVSKFLNNISTGGIASAGVPCEPSQNTHNMFGPTGSTTSFGGTENFRGYPRFVGGSSPNTYVGYALAAGSRGEGAASDRVNVGARVKRFPRPRPASQP